MAEINKTPKPQELIRLIIREAEEISAANNGDLGDEGLHNAAVRLIAEAWGLPATDLETSLAARRVERERAAAAVETENGGQSALTLDLPTPHQLIVTLWGLFGSAIRLERYEDRRKILDMAIYLMDCLGLDDAIPDALARAEAE